MKTKFSAAAALLSLTALAGAQTAPPGNAAKPSAYGSANQGVSQPTSEPILSNGYADSSVVAPVVQPAVRPAAQNPDAGIVEVAVPDTPPAATSNRSSMRSHVDADADIVTEVQESPNQIPEGTPLHARLLDEVSAETATPGTPFSARLTMDVVHMGAVVIPAGSFIHGRVVSVSVGRRISGQSTMKLRPEEVVLPDGTHYYFRGVVTQTFGSGTRTNPEGEVLNTGHPLKTSAEYGAAAGGGAIAGAIVGGPVGATVGAGVGAGMMTVHWLRERNAPVLPAGSGITFALSTPINLTATQATASAVTPQASAVQTEAVPQATTIPAAPVSTYVEPKVQN